MDLIPVNKMKDFEQIEQNTKHVSFAALFKFYLPSIFRELDKILYLDGDMLVLQDLRSVYETDISRYNAAVVKDMAPIVKYKPSILKQLQINHEAYFNSGMMLLNLAQMRQDNATQKLVDYRVNGVNHFMDQDAFNVILGGNVLYLPIWNNYMYTLDITFTRRQLEEYYHETLPINVEARHAKAKILHMTSKNKPWKQYVPELTEQFRTFYEHSPYADVPLTIEGEAQAAEKKGNSPSALGLQQYLAGTHQACYSGMPRKLKIVLTLTTFPARIQTIAEVLLPLMQQTMKPDRILLWLTPEEFPTREEALPLELLALRDHGLEIMWGDNLRPHTKYFHTMKMYPDAIVITVDDDIEYPTNLVETLYNSYLKHPKAISTLRAHLITFTPDGNIDQYTRWHYQCSGFVDQPLMSLFATGVGGVLYPPHLMHEELFNRAKLVSLCLRADDVWLKVMQVMNRVPVVLVAQHSQMKFVGETQSFGLCFDNVQGGRNDALLAAVLQEYNEYFGPKDTLVARMRKDARQYSKNSDDGKRSIWKRLLKKVYPMPVNSFMREINLVKKQQNQTMALLGRRLDDLDTLVGAHYNRETWQTDELQSPMLELLKKSTDAGARMEHQISILSEAVAELYQRQSPGLECNVCGMALTYPEYRFRPYGNPVRFTRCPYCGSLERHRMLQMYLEMRTDVYRHPGLKLLHFAPEPSLYARFSKPEYAIDYYPVDLNQNVKGIVNVVNMESIPYGDNTFDVVIANHVIEHVPDEQKALSEVMRVLKPGGFAILSTLVYQNLAQTLENPEYNTDALRLEHYG